MTSQNGAIVRDGELDVIVLVRVAWGYKWLIIAVATVAAALSITYALIAPKMYLAEAVITKAKDSNMGSMGLLSGQLGGLASVAGVSLSGDSATREAQAILQSRHLAQAFVERYNLLPALEQASKGKGTLWSAVEVLRNDVVSIREDTRKGVTRVAVEWTDPKVAARWANDFVALANELIRTRAIEEATRNIAYLNDQIKKTNVLEIQRVMYDLIQTETKTLMLANGRIEYAFTIVDPAVAPELRVSPRRALIVVLGTFVGAVLGVVVALTHFALRRRA